MKKLATLLAVLPGAALAHGGHAPVPEAAHGALHAGPVVAIAIIALALGLAIGQRWRS